MVYKHLKPMFPHEERPFMVKNVKSVKDAYINQGGDALDFIPTFGIVKPDIFVVNAEGGSDEKRQMCKDRGIEYVELQRTPHARLQARSSSSLKAELSKASLVLVVKDAKAFAGVNEEAIKLHIRRV